MDLMDYVDEMDFSPLPLNTFPLFDFPTNLPFSELLKIKWWSPPSFEWILRKLVVLSNGLYIWIVWIVYGLCMDCVWIVYGFVSFLFSLPHFFQFSPTPRRRSNEIKWWPWSPPLNGYWADCDSFPPDPEMGRTCPSTFTTLVRTCSVLTINSIISSIIHQA